MLSYQSKDEVWTVGVKSRYRSLRGFDRYRLASTLAFVYAVPLSPFKQARGGRIIRKFRRFDADGDLRRRPEIATWVLHLQSALT
jgi:hypothetical protein